MDKITFRQHLDEATKMLIDFTNQHCFNELVDNYRYIITPNSRTIDNNNEHLSKSEISILKTWNKYKNQLLTADQVVNLFHHDNKVPVWIDTTVYESSSNLTVVDLYCSRRLRDDNELKHQGQIMPFHIQVATPPDYLKTDKNGKFDVNWRKHLDNKSKKHSILNKIQQLFR